MHENVYLDPLNDHITTSSFAVERHEVSDKIAHYRKHPLELKILFAICFSAPIFFIGIMWGLHYFNYLVIAISFIGIIIFYFYVKELTSEVISLLLCEKKGWVYNPDPDYARGKRLARLFPDIFDRGDPELRKVDKQIWGTLGHDASIHFWSGMFHYERDADHDHAFTKPDRMDFGMFRTKQQTFVKPVFIIEIGDVIPYSFSLFRHGSERDMKTGSAEFNDNFRIIMHDKGKHAKTHIANILTPAIIVRLIDFAGELPIDCITFQHNCMVVLFDKDVWGPKYTNFVRRVEIDERDIHAFDKLVKHMTELPLEMRKYLHG